MCTNQSPTTKAILVVSFGTSYHDTREKTIDCIEQDIAQTFPHHHIYRAWTSKMILKKLKQRDGIHIDNVREAMERMQRDGITDVTVQPTHVINGIENDLMKEDVLAFSDSFSKITFGVPLLTSEQKSQFEQAGYPVLCHLKGLGEYEGIRQIFLRHIREAQ